jgi:hypothetical protein
MGARGYSYRNMYKIPRGWNLNGGRLYARGLGLDLIFIVIVPCHATQPWVYCNVLIRRPPLTVRIPHTNRYLTSARGCYRSY